MRKSHGNLDLHFLKLDLKDLQSIKSTASEFMQRESRLDILINNAGVLPWALKQSVVHETDAE
jgi:NAD(P)-dependent dehydrogenase (short-subunit alcohol dehydrogenase family)